MTMTNAQQRLLQETAQKVYDMEKEISALDLVIEGQNQVIRDLQKNGGGQGPSNLQLAKQQLDVDTAELNLRALELRMKAEQFKLEREKLEAASCDAANELSPKVILAAIGACLVFGLGGVVAKLG